VNELTGELKKFATEIVVASIDGDLTKVRALFTAVSLAYGAPGCFALSWVIAGAIQRMVGVADLKGYLTTAAGYRPDKAHALQWLADFMTARHGEDIDLCARLFHSGGDATESVRHMLVLAGAAGAIAEEYFSREADSLGDAAADPGDPEAVSAPAEPGPPAGDHV